MGKDNPGKGTTLAWRTCRECGARFMGGPRAWYCPECRRDRQLKQGRECVARKRNGSARPIGSTDLCSVCGKSYVVEGGLQKYCPDCAPDAVKRIDNAQSREWNAANIIPEIKNAKRRVGTREIHCVICGGVFDGYRNQRYCSESCRKAGVRAIMRETDARRAERRKKELQKDKEPPP